MILLDTSIWIEFFRGNSPYYDDVDSLIDENQVVTIEPIFGELFQGARNERERKVLIQYWENLPKPNIRDLLVKAGIESSKNHWMDKGIGLIDSAIIVVAQKNQIKIWSLDKKLNSVLKRSQLYKN